MRLPTRLIINDIHTLLTHTAVHSRYFLGLSIVATKELGGAIELIDDFPSKDIAPLKIASHNEASTFIGDVQFM